MEGVSENVSAASETFCKFIQTPWEHFMAYSTCRKAVISFGLLVSPYSLMGTCNSVQNYTFPAQQRQVSNSLKEKEHTA
jgi:hypothetical protein